MSNFTSYTEFKNAVSSEKLSLILMYPRQGVTTFVSQGSNVWKKTVNNVVNKLFSGATELTPQTSSAVDASNHWFYDITTNELWYYTTSTLPDDDNLISEYILHFSNTPIDLSYDLQDLSKQVAWEPRVLKTVGFKSEIGVDQKNKSIIGKGNIVLQNNDGFFDDMFDTFIWQNKKVEIYSYNRELDPSLAQIQFRGFITGTTFNLDKVSFKLVDTLYSLDTDLPMSLFSLTDGVNDSYVGNVKRRVYGEVDGLLCRSVDQVGTGATMTGTVSGSAGGSTVTGVSTIFLTELAMNDTIIVNGFEHSVSEVTSDTSLKIANTGGLSNSFSGESFTATFEIANPEFNREFFVADHAISQKTTTIVSMTQLNIIEVADITGFEVDDAITIDGTDGFTIFSISSTSIRLNLNASDFYPAGTSVKKEPLTRIYIQGKELSIDELNSVDNVTDCKFTIENTSEFTLATDVLIDDANFTSSASLNYIDYSGTRDILDTFRERDWIKIETDASVNYKRIIYILGSKIYFKGNYVGTAGSSLKVSRRRPDYIDDDSAVSVFARGKTKDDTPTGELITTASDVILDLLKDVDLEGPSNINDDSFTQASLDNSMRLSIAIPYNIQDAAPSLKNIVNDINGTVFGALNLRQDLTLGYSIDSPDRFDTVRTIFDDDIQRWSISNKETKNYKKIIANYKYLDYDNLKKESGNSKLENESDFIVDYDISKRESAVSFRVFEDSDAQELAERFLYHAEQSLSVITIQSDLRLSDVEMADVVLLDFNRFVKSPITNDKKRFYRVVGINKSHNKIIIKLSNLGNIYSRSAVISDDSINDYSSATDDEKRYGSFMVDDNDIITGLNNTKNNNIT